MIFQDMDFTIAQVAHRLSLPWDDNKIIPKVFSNKTLQRPRIDQKRPWQYFDRASQGDPSIYGARAILCFNSMHYLHLKYAFGQGSNN